ncbi:MAG: MFS transporter, partial [Rhodobacteraceae bacterium]|nr:MFS transporter [Paracoccaceae bacterium]
MDERIDRRGVFAWMLFDWANQPFQTLIVTFVFGPYFVARVVGDPVAGQAHWATATAIGGAAVAVLAPLLGAVADRTGARKRWIAAFSLPFVIGCAGLWIAAPEASPLWPILAFFVLAYVGSEFTLIFSNAMLPGLGPRREIGRISGSGWALGYAGGLVALALVLALLTPAPGGTRTLAGLDPVFGLSDALGEPARAVGPASALWYLVFALPLFLFAPDTAPAARLGAA